MATSIQASVNPPLLVWAREQSGYAPDSIADRLKVKLERLLAWERGDRAPTVRQVEKLAKIYQRPFGLFFLPQPPAIPPMAAEYRRLPGVEPGAESPELRIALRIMLRPGNFVDGRVGTIIDGSCLSLMISPYQFPVPFPFFDRASEPVRMFGWLLSSSS